MSTRSAPKKKPGRPRKEAADRPEQFSIRLTPKLKFGLDLLARAQHRSLSQAVEWALQVGLNSYQANQSGSSLSDVLDKVWEEPTEGGRVWAMYTSAPALLGFEDFSTCELIEHSAESKEAFEISRRSDNNVQRSARLMEFVRARWPELRGIAATRAAAGKPLHDQSLAKLLNVDHKARGFLIDALFAWLDEQPA